MDTQLLVKVDSVWESLDLYEEFPISLVIQQIDVSELNSKNSPFTKTFNVPSSKNNDLIFKSYFDVNGIDFNPLNKISCSVQVRGTEIFKGELRMNAVTVNPNFTEYELYIISDVSDFVSELQNLTLRDLDWTDLLHDLNYTAVTQSWNATTGDTQGLFGGKVIYPLINYGLDYNDNGTPLFTYSFDGARGFYQSNYAIPPQAFKPALRVKEIIERIFSNTTYTLKSDFFDTPYFRSIYMDTFVDGNFGVQPISGITNQNKFKWYMKESTAFEYFQLPNQQVYELKFDTYTPDGYDPLNNTNPLENTFKTPYAGDYYFNVKYNLRPQQPVYAGIYQFSQVQLVKGPTANGPWTIIQSGPTYSSALGTASYNLFFSANTQAGEYLQLQYRIAAGSANNTTVFMEPYNAFSVTTAAPMWDLYESPTLIGEQLVDFSLGITDLECLDWFKGIVTMFNLVVIANEEEKSLTIEPLSWYLNESERQQKDWTDKLDLNSTYRYEPLNFQLQKEIDWTYELSTPEYLNKLFEDDKMYAYGRAKFTSPNNVFTGKDSFEVPFAALPSTAISGTTNIIIPELYELKNGQQNPISTQPHIFFWCGNRLTYTDQFKQIQGSYYILNDITSTPVEWTTYPAVSHLSTLDSQFSPIVSDLNFQSTFDFFGNVNTQIVQFTEYNLYNLWWKTYIENTYSPETRRLTGRFFFRPIDIYETNLTDNIFIKDNFYTIEKINEADLVNYKLTEISLIKNITPYYKLTPPAPVYTYTPNQSFPGILPTTIISVYRSTDQTEVCNNTAQIITILIFGTSLTNQTQCWYDNGVQLVYLPLGTYIKQSTIIGAPTYVVSDNFGRVLSAPC